MIHVLGDEYALLFWEVVPKEGRAGQGANVTDVVTVLSNAGFPGGGGV